MSFTSWLRNGRSALAPGQMERKHRRPSTCRLTVEALEDRSVPASLTVSDATILEGNAGTQNALVTVRLSAPSTTTVTVNYRTANETASAGNDYRAASGTLTFARGETSKSILVPVIGDRFGEADETFFVNLNGAKHATIADGQGVVTIRDDEPRISIGDVSGTEGNDGTTPLTFTVTLSAACDAPVTVSFATQDGTAIAGEDYRAASGTLTFNPGGPLTQTITVLVNGDRVGEPDETFFVNLSGPSNAVIADGQGLGTIQDDEPRISIDKVSSAEGTYFVEVLDYFGEVYNDFGTTGFTFTVSLSAPPDAPVIVNYASVGGSDRWWDDSGFGTLTFAPGETTKTVTIQVTADWYPEPDETFYVNLSGASGNAFIAQGQGVGTILDDDGWIPPNPPDPCLRGGCDW